MSKRLDSPLACLLITAAVFLVFIVGRLYQSRFDASSFVVAGDHYCDPTSVPPGLTVLKNSAGFDGQFYYRLALNPFTTQLTEFGITLEEPPYRHQRILYPLLAYLFSFRSPKFLPAVLILINFLVLCLMGWLGGCYAQTLKQHALWGIFLPLYPGFLLTLSRDTVEILEAAILLGSFLLLRRRRTVLATAIVVLAVLTKETTILIVVAGALVSLVARWRKQSEVSVPWYYIAFPIAVFALWQFVQFRIWGEFPVLASGNNNLALPFVGPARAFLDAAIFQRPLQIRKSAELVFLLGFGVTVVSQLRSTNATRHEVFSWLLITVLVISLGAGVWIEDWSFVRVLSVFYILGTVILIAGKGKIKYLVFSCSLVFWCLLFFKLLRSYTLS
jgi:hypothetical protein